MSDHGRTKASGKIPAKNGRRYDHDQSDSWAQGELPAADKVKVELYYESSCQHCREFIREQLSPTYDKIGHIMDVMLVPYGNAREWVSKRGHYGGGYYEFKCRHGREECLGNLIQTCAISVLQKFDSYFPFILCLEGSRKSSATAAETCAQQLQLPLDQIMACATGPLGNKAQHEMAKKTAALVPEHTYVPWIVLNGVHTDEINDRATDNLLKLVCDTYKGPRPPECQFSPWKMEHKHRKRVSRM